MKTIKKKKVITVKTFSMYKMKLNIVLNKEKQHPVLRLKISCQRIIHYIF